MKIIKVGCMDNSDGTLECCNRVYSPEGLVPTIPTNRGGDHIPKIICRMTGRNPESPTSRVPGLPTEQMLEPRLDNLCGTLTTVHKDNLVLSGDYRVRRLTPKESWRLMGFSDNDYNKAAEVNSNTQLYKQAGNSIVKQVLMAIFNQMLPQEGQ